MRTQERGVPLLPPPADMARCRRECGRLVWFFDTGCCAVCDTKPREGRRARGSIRHALLEADAAAVFEESWEQMRAAKGKAA